MKRLAGMVLFNPDPKELEQNIVAIMGQVDTLLLVDNGSFNIDSINRIVQTIGKGIQIIENGNNWGVGKALNIICQYAEENGFEWAITLDQDSKVPDNLVHEYCKYLSKANLGMLCCVILDRNIGVIDSNPASETENVALCITSGSMINISAWKTVGGFCEEMFIDSIDFDMCFSLADAGYEILRVNAVVLNHAIGVGKEVRFRGKKELIFNHSPLRCYYMIRNSIYMGKRHGRLQYGYRWALRRFILINLYEKNKIKKDYMMIKGFVHALVNRYGSY